MDSKADDQIPMEPGAAPSRYKSQKHRDWSTFLHYLKIQKPPLPLSRCSAENVIKFLKYLDQFGKTRVHVITCPHYGQPGLPESCPCPLRQAWGSLDSLIGRLRAAYEENGGAPNLNPFADRAVRVYLHEVRDSQTKARGIPNESKKRKRPTPKAGAAISMAGESHSDVDNSVLPPATAPTTATVK